MNSQDRDPEDSDPGPLLETQSISNFHSQHGYGNSRSGRVINSRLDKQLGGGFQPSSELLRTNFGKTKVVLPINPLPFKERLRILESFELFSSDNPHFSADPILRCAEMLKATVEYYCAFNSDPRVNILAQETARRSILEEGFNDQYSDVYKYSRQCNWSIQWTIPPDYPDLGLPFLGRSWDDFRQFWQSCPKSFTPEVMLPPELLYPWRDKLPEALDILEEYPPPVCKLDQKEISEILDGLLTKPTMIPTMVDFVLAQTNTKVSACHRTLSAALKAAKGGRRVTNYKYITIPTWLDSNQPSSEDYGVRTPVWKRPSEYRDAITLPPGTLLKVWKLNSYLKTMIAHLKEVGDYTSSADLSKFAKQGPLKIMTDWKKSGLTMPHWFVNMVVSKVEHLAGITLDWPADGWPILDPKTLKVFYPNGYGYGLGMINNVYTLFNITLFRYAQNRGIFSSKDKMLSFNDDSIIVTQSSNYNKWVKVCTDSGAYLDIHKTYTSNVAQFCELYQMDNLSGCSFKWVSAFHTLVWSMLNSSCSNHWRYYVSQVWDCIRGYFPDNCSTGESCTNAASTTAEVYIKNFAAAYWGEEFDYSKPPELGGVALGKWYRSLSNLKEGLVILEGMSDEDFIKSSKELYVFKTMSEHIPSFSPWKKFPEGGTKETFKILGDLKGLNNEFSAFKQKAQNKFILDHKWFEEEYWITFNHRLEVTNQSQDLILNFWDWARTVEWQSYAVPRRFVSSSIDGGARNNLLFAKAAKGKPEYSLASMAEAYYELGSALRPTIIPIDKIDFSVYLDYEVPVLLLGEEEFTFISNMETISKMYQFNHPKTVWLDYWFRTNDIITGLNIEDERGKSSLEFMTKIWKTGSPIPQLDGASWWTKHPMPYRTGWLDILSNIPVTKHFEILIALNANDQVEIPEFRLDQDGVANVIAGNPKRWKKKASSKRSSQDKRISELGWTPLGDKRRTREGMLSDFLMEDIQKLAEEAYEKFVASCAEPEPNYKDWFGGDIPSFEIPEEWDENKSWDPGGSDTYDPEETEDEFLRRMLGELENTTSPGTDPGWEADPNPEQLGCDP